MHVSQGAGDSAVPVPWFDQEKAFDFVCKHGLAVRAVGATLWARGDAQCRPRPAQICTAMRTCRTYVVRALSEKNIEPDGGTRLTCGALMAEHRDLRGRREGRVRDIGEARRGGGPAADYAAGRGVRHGTGEASSFHFLLMSCALLCSAWRVLIVQHRAPGYDLLQRHLVARAADSLQSQSVSDDAQSPGADGGGGGAVR